MKRRAHRTRVTHGLLMGLLAVGAGVAVAAPHAFPGESQPAPSGQKQTGSGASAAQPPAEQPAAVPGGAAGMMIYIDPQTGAILKEPAPGTVPLQLTPDLQKALSTSHQGLVEVPSPVPGGGVTVDLQGRFQSPLFDTIYADGKLKMRHLHATPESGEKK